MTEMGRTLKVSARSCKSTPPPRILNSARSCKSTSLGRWRRGEYKDSSSQVVARPMGLSWPSSSSYSGGCYRKSSDWEDPPRGPCANDYRKKVTMGVFNWTWIFFSHLQKLRKNPKVFNCSIWTLSRKYRLKINGKWVLLHPT